MQIVDMHCDTISELLLEAETGKDTRENLCDNLRENLRENSKHVDLRRMKAAGYLLQNFALYVNKQKYPDVKARAWELLRFYKAEIERNADWIGPVTCMADIWENLASGRMSALLTLEEGAALEGSVDNLKEFYDNGVRMITLTWNYPNELGFPHSYSRKKNEPESRQQNEQGCESFGLTSCGFEIVEAMEELGVIVDVSHLSDDGFYDVLQCTKKPFVASHSNARAVCPVSRNLSDEMIRQLARRGGVMGLNFYPPFLEAERTVPGDQHTAVVGTIASVVEHARHIVNVGGVEVLGLGGDFDGISGHAELPGVQAMPRLAEAFAKAGFTASEIDKILGRNVLRVYREVLR